MENGVPETRPAYQAPCAMRMNDLKAGAGICTTGSGDADCCTGNTAVTGCFGNGNSAGSGSGCYGTGSSGGCPKD